MAPSSTCLGGLHTRKQTRKNHLRLPALPIHQDQSRTVKSAQSVIARLLGVHRLTVRNYIPQTSETCSIIGASTHIWLLHMLCRENGVYLILKFFQIDITAMFRMTSSARYFKEGVGSSRPN
jgi:hypothetical protein